MKAGLSEGFRFPVEPIPHVCSGGGGHLRGGASHQLRTSIDKSLPSLSIGLNERFPSNESRSRRFIELHRTNPIKQQCSYFLIRNFNLIKNGTLFQIFWGSNKRLWLMEKFVIGDKKNRAEMRAVLKKKGKIDRFEEIAKA